MPKVLLLTFPGPIPGGALEVSRKASLNIDLINSVLVLDDFNYLKISCIMMGKMSRRMNWINIPVLLKE